MNILILGSWCPFPRASNCPPEQLAMETEYRIVFKSCYTNWHFLQHSCEFLFFHGLVNIWSYTLMYFCQHDGEKGEIIVDLLCFFWVTNNIRHLFMWFVVHSFLLQGDACSRILPILLLSHFLFLIHQLKSCIYSGYYTLSHFIYGPLAKHTFLI